MLELQAAAESLGLYSEGLKGLKPDHLGKWDNDVGIILHIAADPETSTTYNHYVLFLDDEGADVLLFDPFEGVVRYSKGQLLAQMSGFGLIVSKERGLLSFSQGFASPAVIFAVMIFSLFFVSRRFAHARIEDMGHNFDRWMGFALGGAVFIVSVGAMGMASLLWHSISPAGFFRNSDVIATIRERNFSHFLPEYSASEVAELLRQDNRFVVIVDARFSFDYEAGSLPGAISIPVDASNAQIESALRDVDRSAEVVVFCQSSGCPFAERIAKRLKNDFGMNNLALFSGGWLEWLSHSKQHVEPNTL